MNHPKSMFQLSGVHYRLCRLEISGLGFFTVRTWFGWGYNYTVANTNPKEYVLVLRSTQASIRSASSNPHILKTLSDQPQKLTDTGALKQILGKLQDMSFNSKGISVWGLGFRVYGFRFRVWGFSSTKP